MTPDEFRYWSMARGVRVPRPFHMKVSHPTGTMKEAPALLTQPGTVPNTWMRGIEMTDRICSVEGCDLKVQARGVCNPHYKRLRRAGELELLPKLTERERFWAKVNKTETCWLWTATNDGHGYGAFNTASRRSPVKAHRFAYEDLVGPIPEGMQLDHLCRTPLCVNPAHLEPVTHAENMRRGNGWSGTKFRQTHCVHGHPFDEENTYVWSDGRGHTRRYCRTCAKRRESERVRDRSR